MDNQLFEKMNDIVPDLPIYIISKLNKMGVRIEQDMKYITSFDLSNIGCNEIQQRKIIQQCRNAKKKVYVATNFLESMIYESSPTRGEVNDIYSTLEQGANGLVLAAETAIGKYPIECVEILKKIIKNFNKNLQ